jgi:2-amino-4-hydroxy-6-hydroxymethyldihydropteridine diphosphokinase
VILVAVGANLPGPKGETPLETCEAAVRALAGLPCLTVDALSQWYETAPVPPSGQPNYVNGVVRLSGNAGSPEAFLAALQDIESRFGRVRGEPNAARTLDLDIIDMNGMVRTGPDPILPHPRAHVRVFVLRPLLDVAPDWVCPVSGRSGRALLEESVRAGP